MLNITETVNDRGKEPILNMIKAIGHWPLLEGTKWDESQWDWKKTILNFRKYVSKQEDDIFNTNKVTNNLIDTVKLKEICFNIK